MTKLKVFTGLLWLLLTILICYQTYIISSDATKSVETIKMFLLMLGGYSILFTIIHNLEIMQQKMETDKLENTYRLIKDWDNENLFEARKLTRSLKKKKEIS